jgi:hypothetical protein
MRIITLAEGAKKLDVRFKKGGRTKVAVPASMQNLIDD